MSRTKNAPLFLAEGHFTDKHSPVGGNVIGILFDPEGTVWAGTYNELFKFIEGNWAQVEFPSAGQKSYESMFFLPNGEKWIETTNWLYQYTDCSLKSNQRFDYSPLDTALSSQGEVYAGHNVKFDNRGTAWVLGQNRFFRPKLIG